jgi:hypothetical protein
MASTKLPMSFWAFLMSGPSDDVAEVAELHDELQVLHHQHPGETLAIEWSHGGGQRTACHPIGHPHGDREGVRAASGVSSNGERPEPERVGELLHVLAPVDQSPVALGGRTTHSRLVGSDHADTE